MPTRLVIADDHSLFRQGLKSLLQLQPELEVVAEVDRAEDLDQALAAHPCDILLLDLQMNRWMMEEIPRLAQHVKVIVLTASESPEHGVQALRFGARAIVQKRFALETLMTAIKALAEDLVWMPPEVQAEFAAEFMAQETSSAKKLTARESEIVKYVGSGMRNGAIAERLAITEATVKTHLNNIFQKLNLRSRVELARYAYKHGLVGILPRER